MMGYLLDKRVSCLTSRLINLLHLNLFLFIVFIMATILGCGPKLEVESESDTIESINAQVTKAIGSGSDITSIAVGDTENLQPDTRIDTDIGGSADIRFTKQNIMVTLNPDSNFQGVATSLTARPASDLGIIFQQHSGVSNVVWESTGKSEPKYGAATLYISSSEEDPAIRIEVLKDKEARVAVYLGSVYITSEGIANPITVSEFEELQVDLTNQEWHINPVSLTELQWESFSRMTKELDMPSIPMSATTPIEVTYPDTQLEIAIREAIGKSIGSITLVDLHRLEYLDASSKGITDLEGLQYCVNLTELYLQNNQITDISPITSLTRLNYLNISFNPLIDISPLASLTRLAVLNLYDCPIEDISPLASLTNLQGLDLGSNINKSMPTDISPLVSLTNLVYLNLTRCQISDVSLIASFTNLIQLELHDNQINDISPLISLGSLKSLDLSRNQISDISPLASLASLETLYIFYNQIVDISPLASLKSLGSLNLSYNQIVDISPLASLKSLYWLDTSYNQIVDISPLTSLTNLGSLILNNNKIADISSLASLTRLWSLLLNCNQISDISPLSSLTNLTQLYLSQNQVSDISSLAFLPNMGDLDLRGNPISDISPLVKNNGLGAGDRVALDIKTLSDISQKEYVPQLRARGVQISLE